VELQPHPDAPHCAASCVELTFEREGARLWLRYHLEAMLDDLVLPGSAEPVRTDGLWQTTCFELFVRAKGEKGYLEFNFSPSHRWAAYRFSGYREGQIEAQLAAPPDIGLDASESHFALEAELVLPEDIAERDLELGLSAVIEETDGTKSYWALRHPPGKPDFHHPDCFALELPASPRA
jgi:hypothetical protein